MEFEEAFTKREAAAAVATRFRQFAQQHARELAQVRAALPAAADALWAETMEPVALSTESRERIAAIDAAVSDNLLFAKATAAMAAVVREARLMIADADGDVLPALALFGAAAAALWGSAGADAVRAPRRV